MPVLGVAAAHGTGWLRWDALPCPARALPAVPGAVATAGVVAGAALVAGSAALRVLAKGVLVRKTTVTSAGVYGWVRHPFYLANLAGAAGTLLLAGPAGVVVAAAWLAAALPVYRVTIAGEEAGLRGVHGAAWDAYAARVPALLPRRFRGGGGPGPTWANLVTEGEPPRLLRFLAGAALVIAAHLDGAAGAGAAAAAGGAWAASHVVALSVRRPRR